MAGKQERGNKGAVQMRGASVLVFSVLFSRGHSSHTHESRAVLHSVEVQASPLHPAFDSVFTLIPRLVLRS